MATKKELIQAQAYSRRRLLTAFVSGIPGGKELEPAKPLRAVVMGVALSVLVLLVSLIIGLVNPALPKGWENNSLLIVKDSGARYLTKNGVLYPVINATSAQLIIPNGQLKVVTVTADKIATAPRGETIGILGAPDSLPTADNLLSSTWVSCIRSDSGSQITILSPRKALTQPTSDALLVELEDKTADANTYLIANGYRYKVADTRENFARALGLDGVAPLTVEGRWLNLFTEGTPLTALPRPAADGAPPLTVEGKKLTAGSVIHFLGDPEEKRFVYTATGELAELTPLAYRVYTSSITTEVVDVPPAEIVDVKTASSGFAPEDWPHTMLTPAEQENVATCATMKPSRGKNPTVKLSIITDESLLSDIEKDVTVPPARGSLVNAIGTDAPTAGSTFVIDSSGVAFPIPNATEDVLSQLKYEPKNVLNVPQSWINVFPAGPSLDQETAMKPPAEPNEGTGTGG